MRKHANQPRTISFEPLEPRVVMSASTSTATSALLNLLYSIDGTGNNQANPNWGAANQPLYRDIVAANYADGISALNDKAATDPTVTLPSARDISNLLGTQTDSIQDDRDLSAFIYAWGQFIDHDLDLTPDGGTSAPITTASRRSAICRLELPIHALADRCRHRHRRRQSAESAYRHHFVPGWFASLRLRCSHGGGLAHRRRRPAENQRRQPAAA